MCVVEVRLGLGDMGQDGSLDRERAKGIAVGALFLEPPGRERSVYTARASFNLVSGEGNSNLLMQTVYRIGKRGLCNRKEK